MAPINERNPEDGFILAGAVFGGKHKDEAAFFGLHQLVNFASRAHLKGVTIGAVYQLHLVLRFAGHLNDWNDLDPVRKVTVQENGTVLGLEIVFRQFDLRTASAMELLVERMPLAVERALNAKATRDHKADIAAFRPRFEAFLEEFH